MHSCTISSSKVKSNLAADQSQPDKIGIGGFTKEVPATPKVTVSFILNAGFSNQLENSSYASLILHTSF